MFDAVTVLLQRLWESIQAGWNWLQRLARTLIADIGNALMPPRQAALAVGGSVAAAPPSTPANPPKAALSPPQKARSVPAPVAQPSAPTAATQPETERAPATAQSDETALARMLASDDGQREVKFVRGWIAVELQRARKVSMFQFLTRGLGYGPRSRKSQGQLNVYASTATEPSETDRAIARSLLSGASLPSAQIRMHKPGQLIERGKAQTDAQILRKQADLKEGIYGRLQGTDWFLLSPDAPAITPRKGQTATEAIDAVPTVPVMDLAQS